MELMGYEGRRNIKPGDIFRAHLAASAGSGASGTEVPEVDEVLAASVRIERGRRKASADPECAADGMLHGHESFFSGDLRVPYHWGVSLPRFSSRHVDSSKGNMHTLQSDVMDAIHNALSKEALIKKLVMPFNDNCFDSKHAVSQWEWQKNSALLELEHRNQQLQSRLNDAANQVMEAHTRAEYDRKLLEEALQKGKEELYLIGRAETMRTRLIERTQIIARSQLLCTFLFSWWRYIELCRKKRTLKKAESYWQRLTLIRRFDRFIAGCKQIRNKQQLSFQARRHWFRKCFKGWWMRSQWKEKLKKTGKQLLELCTSSRLRTGFQGWQEFSKSSIYKKLQLKRARKLNGQKSLQKSWTQWNICVEEARDQIVGSGVFCVKKLVSTCVKKWRTVVLRKKRHIQQMTLGIQLRESKALLVGFEIWHRKIRTVHVVKDRMAYFGKRRRTRLLQLLLTKWHQHVLRTWYLRTIEKLLAMKAKIWYLRWGFSQIKHRWVIGNLVEEGRSQRRLLLRSALFHYWKSTVKFWKAAKEKVAQVQKSTARRRLQRFFYHWTVYVADRRRSSAVQEAHKLEVMVKVLEIDLKGADLVQREMDKLVLELENGRRKIINSAEAALARNPVWTSGFLDVLLRWTTPLLSWFPSARAGHTAVSLPKKIGSEICSRLVVFGGFDGEEYFNDVILFETDEMVWKTAASSAAEGCVVPSPRQTHTACPVGDQKMIIFGGFDGTKDFSDVSVLNISEDESCQWSQPASVHGAKPGPVCQHTSCLYENGPYMVVFGGYRSSVGLLNELWFLDVHWMLWSSPEYFGTPPVPRRGHGAAIIGTKMFVFGGFNGSENLADLHFLDFDSMTWNNVEVQGEVPSPRRQFAVAIVGQHFVLHGGFDGQKYLGDVFSFHTIHKRWNKWPEKETQLSLQDIGQGGEAHGRSMHTMVESGQRLVIFGGVHEWGALQDILFIENASAIEGLHLQKSLLEELEKAKMLHVKMAECEDAVRTKNRELIKSQEDIEELRTTLKVESDKRKKAVQGHHVLSKKLQKARNTSDYLSQKYKRLRKETEQWRKQSTMHVGTLQQASET
ncbi:hypothetical protein MPTK1_5g09080 [Marchantia polymorpha subsp. ruderalis]